MEERLQKLISQAGIASRRAAEKMIEDGRVYLNGQVAHLGDKADLSRDVVSVDGLRLKPTVEFVYVLLNKPRNVVCTNKPLPNEKRRTARELIPHKGHIYTVGRLDADSEGLILLTNDGDLANKLMHPRYEHTKTYKVLVEGSPSPGVIEKWRQGVELDGQRTAPAKVRLLSTDTKESWLQIVMHEGRKRQIRRIASDLGHPVKRLIRIKIDMLEIGHLRPGDWRDLSAAEVRLLKNSTR